MKNRRLVFRILSLLLCTLCGCGSAAPTVDAPAALPAPSEAVGSAFGVDENINIGTIDAYLGREDVAYRDMRMLFDPANYSAIGGEADLTHTIDGFKIVPFPYIATLQPLPVEGAYESESLFDVTWREDGTVADASANYTESLLILEELFPKDKAIFLMCGGGGYAGMMKRLLIYLGWDGTKLYNIGANWEYTGSHAVELVIYPEDANGRNIYATWRADYAYFDFDKMEPIGDIS